MGTTIEGVSFVHPHVLHRRSALALAEAASRHCLHAASRTPDEVQLLINAGLYRDHDLAEPALAALIQEDVGMNEEDPHPDGHGTFSFDLANGACGVLTAFGIADGFIRAGTIEQAMVVTSDADPAHGLTDGFPFEPAGGAVLLGPGDDGEGLGTPRFVTMPDEGASWQARVHSDGEGHANRLQLEHDGTFAEKAAIAAAKAVAAALDADGMRVDEVDVAIVAPSDDAFVADLVERTGIPRAKLALAPVPTLHTVALVAALDAARAQGRLQPGQVALLVCAGAGVTAGACTYRA